ncbi:MAG: nascent polypeptide-associated complex protein [Candidatus Diapherotrites archaeon]|nr:nascent polypeptide-associated complex protein [Candidatus Diapherotrites archaeon]
MFPGKINPRQMQAMMKQMGIQTEDIPAKRVIIETSGKRIVIEPASVNCMIVQGQKTYTVNGTESTEAIEQEISLEDIEMVAEQAGVHKEVAEKALKETKGDIAEAILKLKKD